MAQDIFELKLTSEGSKTLLKMYTWVKLCFILSIILSIGHVVMIYLQQKTFFKLIHTLSTAFQIQSYAVLTYNILGAISLPIQFFLFFRFTRQSKKSIESSSFEGLSRSFQWLLEYVYLTALLFVLSVGLSIVMIYAELQIASLYE